MLLSQSIEFSIIRSVPGSVHTSQLVNHACGYCAPLVDALQVAQTLQLALLS